MNQKFHTGDLVKIVDDLGPRMNHFQSGVEGIILGSYKDLYGGSNVDSYSLYIEGRGNAAWYYENQLTLIEKHRTDLLEQWKRDMEQKEKQMSLSDIGGFQGSPTDPYKLTGFQSKTTGDLDKALAAAQAEFKPVNKSKTAKVRGEKNGRPYEYSYKYADLGDILSMALPLLSKNGVSFSQPLRRRDGKLVVVTRLACGNEVLEDDGLLIPEAVKPQELGTYLTYYRRYSASTALGISTDEDVDGPSDGGEVKETSSSGQVKKLNPIDRGQHRHSVLPGDSAIPVNPEPTTGTDKFVASESDIPSNIGSAPDKTVMTKIKADLKGLGVEMDKLKAYSLKVTGKAETKLITTQEWNDLIKSLTDAKAIGTIEQLVA